MPSFNGTIFHVWKGNHPCRIYAADGKVYFIRRIVGPGIAPGTAAVMGAQFGLIGGLAAGIAGAAKAKTSADFVRDDDHTPPAQLVSKHTDNHAIPVADIIDPRIEAQGKFMSYGRHFGRWHFTRRGEDKETVVLFDSPDDVQYAVFLLGAAFGSRLKNESGVAGAQPPDVEFPSHFTREAEPGSGTDLITNMPLPADQADVVAAMQNLTKLLGERTAAGWKTIRCEVRAAPRGAGRALEIVIADGDNPDDRLADVDADIYTAAMRLARKMSTSISTFPGLVVAMKYLGDGRWHINTQVMEKR